MNHLRTVCSFAVLVVVLGGCSLQPTTDLFSTAPPETPTRPSSSPSSQATAAPTALASALPTPSGIPAVPDEEGVLRALYGDQLQGSAQTGWSVGRGTVPWVGPIAAGSFTAPGAIDVVALVGGLSSGPPDTASDGQYLDVRWVVLNYDGGANQPWRVVGRSASLGFNLERTAVPWRVSAFTDFDQDGRQELLAVSSDVRPDFHTETTHLFRWDGESLAQVWTASTYEDDIGAASAPVYYIYEAQVAFEQAGDRPELVLSGSTRYFGKDEQGQADTNTVTSSETINRRFRWDGTRFNEFSAAGPTSPLAFTDADGLWLWAGEEVRQLDDRRVDQLAWSPDGTRLAYEVWWPSEEQGIWLYDTRADGKTRLVATEAAAYTLQWSPDGQMLAYPLADPAEIQLYDLSNDIAVSLPADAESLSWAPDGQGLVYPQQGGLTRYDLVTQRTEPLVRPSPGGPGVYRATWSPRGDLIACVVAHADGESPALVPADLAEPVEIADLPGLGVDLSASRIEMSWSPQGDRIAILAVAPQSVPQPGVLYVVEAPPGWTGQSPLEPIEFTRLADPIRSASTPAWSPDGQRLAAMVGAEVWVWDVASGAGQRWHTFSVIADEASLHWAPEGGALLAHGGNQIYWLPADASSDPALLLERNGLDQLKLARE